MKMLPGYEVHGYRAIAVLGVNAEGGRRALKAERLADGLAVVIKEFSFATPDASWEHYESHQRELSVLASLDHPRIPAYLGDFQTERGFCMVQVYCDAPPMGTKSTSSVDSVLATVHSGLDVLIYLQTRVPPVIHRDIKPGNLLVDGDDQVHVVDFGLARTDAGATSTIAVGTPGFMPPEQLLGHRLTAATDLYGFGASVFCLASGTAPDRLGSFVDSSFTLDLDRIANAMPDWFVKWLSQMVDPSLERRFASASEAKEALEVLSKAASPAPKPRPVMAPLEPQPEQRLPQRKVSPRSSNLPVSLRPEKASNRALAQRPGKASNRRRWVFIAAGLAAFGGFAMIMSSAMMTLAPKSTAKGNDTVVCKTTMTQTESITGLLGGRAALVIHPGCKLDADGIEIAGTVVVTGGSLELRNVRFSGGTRGLDIRKEASVKVFDSTMSCGGSRCVAQNAGELLLSNVTAESSNYAVDVGGGNATIDNSNIAGRVTAVLTSNAAARVTVTGSRLTGWTAVAALGGVLKVQGSTLKGRVYRDETGAIKGLETSTVDFGDEDPAGAIAELACSSVVDCVKAHVVGETVIDVKLSIDTDGVSGRVGFIRGSPKDPVGVCIVDALERKSIQGAAGRYTDLQCTVTGAVSAAGTARLSRHFRGQ